MIAAHTPGPWYWRGNTLAPVNADPYSSAVHSILDAEGGYGYLGTDYRLTRAELDADRRLIAAAPDLLAALQALVAEAGPRMGLDDTPGTINTMSRLARAAIAKATGGAA